MNTNTLPQTKYPNQARTITGNGNGVLDDDVELLCDTSLGVVGIDLALLVAGYWSTQYKLYVTDKSGNASVNNITLNAPAGYLINGASTYVMNTNSASVQVFICSDTIYGVSNAVTDSANDILNNPFGIAWSTVTNKGASQKSLYDVIIPLITGFGNVAFVRQSGDDTKGQLGNFFAPFATIGAATTALGSLTQSSLYIDAGNFALTDINAPFGLKKPNSSYDIYCAAGCNITYSGSYGLYISGSTETGNIYGNGNFRITSSSFSGSVDSVSNYAINIGGITTRRFFNISLLDTITTGTNAIRFGSTNGAGSIFNFERITSVGAVAGKAAITFENSCIFNVFGEFILSTGGVAPIINLDDTGSSFFGANLFIASIQQQDTVNTNTVAIVNIENSQSATTITFNNTLFANSQNARLAFVSVTNRAGDILFNNVTMKESSSTAHSIISTSGAITVKLANVIATKILGTSPAVTNQLTPDLFYNTPAL